jgi:hypothetical protein
MRSDRAGWWFTALRSDLVYLIGMMCILNA